eukprot:1133330-Pleurochrysis_carterae.AAC.1
MPHSQIMVPVPWRSPMASDPSAVEGSGPLDAASVRKSLARCAEGRASAATGRECRPHAPCTHISSGLPGRRHCCNRSVTSPTINSLSSWRSSKVFARARSAPSDCISLSVTCSLAANSK